MKNYGLKMGDDVWINTAGGPALYKFMYVSRRKGQRYLITTKGTFWSGDFFPNYWEARKAWIKQKHKKI